MKTINLSLGGAYHVSFPAGRSRSRGSTRAPPGLSPPVPSLLQAVEKASPVAGAHGGLLTTHGSAPHSCMAAVSDSQTSYRPAGGF